MFAGVAAVTAQVGSYSRTANGISFAVLGVAFLLRAVGGLRHRVVAVVAVAARLVAAGPPVRREQVVGAAAAAGRRRRTRPRGGRAGGAPRRRHGPVAPRDGRAGATPSLRTPLALAWRLQRGALVGWLVAFVLMGLVLGSLAGSVTDLLSGNATAQDIFTRLGGSDAIEQAFVAAMLMVLGLGAAVYGVQAVLRARAEETEGRAEVVLATATSRLSWFGSHLLCAGGGATVLVLAGATAVGAAAAPDSGVTFTQTLAAPSCSCLLC